MQLPVESKATELVIPPELVAFWDRLYFIECTREVLRRQANAVGEWLTKGAITKLQWKEYNAMLSPMRAALTEAFAKLLSTTPKALARTRADDHVDLTRIDLNTVFKEVA